MNNEIVSIHLCVSWNGETGRVRPYESSLCSNCRPGDPRVFNLAVPKDQYESTKKRVEDNFAEELAANKHGFE